MTRSKWKRILIIALYWAAISQVLFLYAHTYFTSQVSKEVLAGLPYNAFFIQIAYLVMGFFGGCFFGYVMLTRRPQVSSFAASILRISWLYVVAFLASTSIVTTAITLTIGGVAGLSLVPVNLIGVLFNSATLISFFTWGLVVAGTQFMVQVNEMLGQGVLKNLIVGKYFKPAEENRIFMFMDLKSSTQIAEALGHTVFFEFLQETFKDITQCILDHHGEIYQYVGDEVVISWPMNVGIQDARCVNCFLQIRKLLKELSSAYERRFGAAPVFKAGLHHGLVTIGEIGIIKKDIVFTGDVLNTTSRIQEQCNQYDAELLISEDTLRMIESECENQFDHIGAIELRGKRNEVDLYALSG